MKNSKCRNNVSMFTSTKIYEKKFLLKLIIEIVSIDNYFIPAINIISNCFFLVLLIPLQKLIMKINKL